MWKRLQNCVAPGLLPTFSERAHKRKRSSSSSTGDSPDKKKTTAPSTPSSVELKSKITLLFPCQLILLCGSDLNFSGGILI